MMSSYAVLRLRDPLYGDEALAGDWDDWVKFISHDQTAAHARACFDGFLQSVDTERREAADEIDRLNALVASFEKSGSIPI